MDFGMKFTLCLILMFAIWLMGEIAISQITNKNKERIANENKKNN